MITKLCRAPGVRTVDMRRNRFPRLLSAVLLLLPAADAIASPSQRASAEAAQAPEVRRISTAVPFPRGLVLREDGLYVLARGRVRGSGGVDVKLDDRAGTLWRVDPSISEAIGQQTLAVARNGTVIAEPTSPPFNLLDRSLDFASGDDLTDRPYCGLRWHEGTQSFYICAFSGIDLSAADPAAAQSGSFKKNYTDGVLRYDTRTGEWSEVERHDPAAGAAYPHGDELPQGWVKGPDNLLPVGENMLVVAKDNSRLIAYDLRPLKAEPTAGPPEGREVLGETVWIDGQPRTVLGHSGLAYDDGWLYISFRTTSEIVRVPVTNDRGGEFAVDAKRAELLALFDPFDPDGGRQSANLTDIDIGPDGDVFVVSAYPARVFRFRPDSGNVQDYRTGSNGRPWVDLAATTRKPKMKSENVLVAPDGRVFVTSGDAYGHEEGLGGAVWVIEPGEPGE